MAKAAKTTPASIQANKIHRVRVIEST